jgi:transcriptional regulator with GAF, ATPase, and Fis domain
MVGENEFFRNVTLKLCRHLAIEEGLRACIEYISQFIPADSLYLEMYDIELGAMRMVARARPGNAEKMNLLVPMPEPIKAEMARQLSGPENIRNMPAFRIFDKGQDDLICSHLLTAVNEPVESSVIALPLAVEDKFVGALILIAYGNDRFEEQHGKLFATLKEPFFVAMSNTLKHEEVVKLKDYLADDNRFLNRELLRIAGDEIVGADFGLRDVMHQIRQVAPTDSLVLLTGETGAGKDVIANAIHLSSPRRDNPFISVNCGAIPESLIDSELFGHEKGAFTGALSQKRGRFERAHTGTIFLDEIGEMPLEVQVRLLRVIQNREVERIGGIERIPVDIRIIAATNQDLKQMVLDGRFREDLWYRLNVFPITVPPLRERTDDIPALVQCFIERKTKELKIGTPPRLASGAIDRLMTYSWPGNVRELENLVERVMILNPNGPLNFDELESFQQYIPPQTCQEADEIVSDLDAIVSQHIKRALKATGGKIHGPEGAGELLGLNPNTLRYKMKKLGIPFGKA